jgi:EAL and modified HD-GYP domain-containing signal transduction protein
VPEARATQQTASKPASALETIQLGRQAIYDASLHSRAYELFYREAEGARAESDADRATCSVVLSAFAELGLARVASQKRVFLPVAHDVMSGALPLPVSPSVVVLQARDYEHSVSELARGLEQRKRDGFEVALDGFMFDARTAPLAGIADYLKFNVRQLGVDGLARQLELVGPRACRTVACRIETSAEFNACVAAGCTLFQGHFLFRPQFLSHKRLPKNLKTITQLLKRLRDPSIEFAEIERIVRTDPVLAAAVLKFLGSAAYALPQSVTSIAQAVSLLGLREFSKWVTVVALTSTTERPSEISLVALTRARASELVAGAVHADPDAAFLVGLVSSLDALFQRPLPSLLDELPLSAEVRGAVLEHTGLLGKILVDVLSREEEEAALSTRFETGMVNRSWLDALSWANDTQAALR